MIEVEKLSQEVGIRQACEALGVSRASFYRRQSPAETAPKTQRTSSRALTDPERQAVKDELYSERHLDSSPRQVYAKLLDEGRYLCSVRTMYRILEEEDASQERRNQLRHPAYTKPELLATAPNEVWSWDITKLRGPRKGMSYHLYVILDIYSRYVVGWMLAHRESASLASRLIRESVEKQQVSEDQLTLHSDRGPSMGSHSVAQLLATLGVTKSHSRPQVSNDNPFSESQFKTLKYCPEFPNRFDSFEHALRFCRTFFGWYNDEHYHTGIGLLTPAMVHSGQAEQVLDSRGQVLQNAFERHPERFVKGPPKPPQVPTAVWINPPPPAQDKGLPEPVCPQKPGTPLTHPRPDSASSSCVPAELDSVSSGTNHDSHPNPFEHPSHASKNPGGLGAGPQEPKNDSLNS